MKRHIVVLTILSAIFLSGCFGSFKAVPVQMKKSGSDIAVDMRLTRDVGDVILNRYDYTELQGIALLDDYVQSHMLGSINIKNGSFLEKYKDKENEENYYCGMYYTSPGSPKVTNTICFLDEFDDLEKYYILFSGHYKNGPFSSSGLISYRKSFSVDKSKPFHKMELIYDGVKSGMILFTYKEFTESLTKPAFYSQVRYLKNRNGEPTDISYRSAKIRIYEASNSRIVYKIISPFRDEQENKKSVADEYEKFSDHSGYESY